MTSTTCECVCVGGGFQVSLLEPLIYRRIILEITRLNSKSIVWKPSNQCVRFKVFAESQRRSGQRGYCASGYGWSVKLFSDLVTHWSSAPSASLLIIRAYSSYKSVGIFTWWRQRVKERKKENPSGKCYNLNGFSPLYLRIVFNRHICLHNRLT